MLNGVLVSMFGIPLPFLLIVGPTDVNLDGKPLKLVAGIHYFVDAQSHATAVPEVAAAWAEAGYSGALGK